MMQTASPAEVLAAVRIVLVSPAGPLNVGAVARVMKNFGLSQLVLVTPECDPLEVQALQMAVHADDVLRAAMRVESIPAALVGCELAIATTARVRGFNAPLQLPEVALSSLIRLSTSSAAAASTALIFGPEDRGLSNAELAYAQSFVKIPTTDTYSALNLAQAVAVCCYELYRSAELKRAPTAAPDSVDSPLQNAPSSDKQTESDCLSKATLDELEGYYQHLESVLLRVEYLYPHTAATRMRKLRHLLHRTNPTSNEVALLRGMLRQMEWALSDSKSDSKKG